MNYKFKNIVFEGGGVKGVAYGGALLRLEEIVTLSEIERVAGTSAGAITACLLAVGYDANSISKIIASTDFSKFEDDTFLFIRDIYRLIKHYGWNRGDTFEKWLGDLIEQKTGNRDLTFQKLHEKVINNEPGYKELYVVATNVTKQRAESISFETYPELTLVKAVRMSMSIPVFFTSVKYEENMFVDGGLTANFPVQIFDNKKYLSNPQNGILAYSGYDENFCFNYETLGFRVDSAKEKNYLNPTWEGDPSSTKSLKKFIMSLINFTIEMVNKKHLNKNDWNRTIFIDSGDVGTTEFKLKQDKIDFLIHSGVKGVDDYFLWKNNDLVWKQYPK
jgi:NTE family protein